MQNDNIQLTQTIRVAPNNVSNNSPSGPLHQVIVRPTQLVPVLPATSQSVLKRVVPPPTSVSTIVPHTSSQIIIKQETSQGKQLRFCFNCDRAYFRF